MREIALFVEDFAHQKVIGALVQRLADEYSTDVRFNWRSAVRGHGRVVRELRDYLRDLRGQGSPLPDLIIVATDANCRGLNERVREMDQLTPPAPMILAIPDPHIERWLLLDSAAFKTAVGRGCDAPDRKCNRDLYKQRLIAAIHVAGIMPSLGGIEFAEDIVQSMDINRAKRADRSFQRFVDPLVNVFQQWQRETDRNEL